MKLDERYYNIHDIVKFKIVSKAGPFSWQFNNIYSNYRYFKSEKIAEPDFTVYLGKFAPSNEDCYITDYKYYIKEDYFYCKNDSYKFANWKFEMSGFEDGNTIVRIASNIFGYISISAFIIDFLIQYKMNEKGYPLVHAAGISQNGRGFLFPATSKAGKTTIVFHFLEKNFDLLGDDFIIVGKSIMHSFVRPSSLFTYNIPAMVKKRFGIKDWIGLGLRYLLSKITLGYIKLFMKLNAEEIFPNSLVSKSELGAVFVLMPQQEFRLDKLDKEDLISRLVTNQKLQSLYFNKYILEYSYLFPASKLAAYWDKYEANLTRNLGKGVPFYKVGVPLEYYEGLFEQIAKAMQ